MRPHSQKLYKTESGICNQGCTNQMYIQMYLSFRNQPYCERHQLIGNWTIVFSHYSTSTLQECIRQTYCMYISMRWRNRIWTAINIVFLWLGFFAPTLFAKWTNNTILFISEFKHESSTISCGRRFAINFYVWVSQHKFCIAGGTKLLNGSQAPSLRPHVLNIEITLPKTNKQFRPENKPSQKDVSFREAENDSLVQGSAIFFTRPARVPCSTGNLRNERFGCDRCTMN